MRWIFLMLIAVSLGLTQWMRISTEREVWCEKCEVEVSLRLWQEPWETWSEYIINYRGLRIHCPYVQDSCGYLLQVEPGDYLTVIGKIESGVTEFDRGKKRLINTRLLAVEHMPAENRFSLWWWVRRILDAREEISRNFARVLPEPESGLLSGIVMGLQRAIPRDFYEDLIRTGVVHVVAASGFNITLVSAVAMNSLVLVIRRKWAVIAAVVMITAYVFLAGMGAAVTRAAIMGTISFAAMAMGREYVAKWGLATSAWLMLLYNPWLIHEVSFQLSVAATAGILWGSGWVSGGIERGVSWLYGFIIKLFGGVILEGEKRPIGSDLDSIAQHSPGSRMTTLLDSIASHMPGFPPEPGRQNDDIPRSYVPANRHVADYSRSRMTGNEGGFLSNIRRVMVNDMSVSVAATLSTLPITIIVFGRVSVLGPLVNGLVLWLIPPIMGAGGVLAGAGMVGYGLDTLVSLVAQPLLWLFVRIVQMFAMVPGMSVELEGFSWTMAIGWWLVLAALWARGEVVRGREMGL